MTDDESPTDVESPEMEISDADNNHDGDDTTTSSRNKRCKTRSRSPAKKRLQRSSSGSMQHSIQQNIAWMNSCCKAAQ